MLDEYVTCKQIERLCSGSATDRERDCREVRELIDRNGFDILSGGIRDESGLAELSKRMYLDESVRQAVVEMVRETGAAFHTPPDSGESSRRS